MKFSENKLLMLRSKMIFLFVFLVITISSEASILKISETEPLEPRYYPQMLQDPNTAENLQKWTPEDGTNIWEHSGLLEGDIMVEAETDTISNRNGILSESKYWPNATVPYFFRPTFIDEDVNRILDAMQEFHNKTCIRFRPYKKGDRYWIDFHSDKEGCWSIVGMKEGGQIINLLPTCIARHYSIVHELMHTLGFYHQHMAPDRDEYIKIQWENIVEGKEKAFTKKNGMQVSQFGVPYDYDSVMHYSQKMFSKNGKNTFELLKRDEPLAPRTGLSDGDVQKINTMYKDSCNINIVNITD